MRLQIPVIKPEDLFVIGDVHGCAEELTELLHKLPMNPRSSLLFIGDYVDRGPASRQVIEIILAQRERREVFALLGNHETLLFDFLDDPTPLNQARFMFNGGGATLQSYSDTPDRFTIPSNHLEFLRSLPVAYQSDEHVFVHAGLPDVPLDELEEEEHGRALLWLRETFHQSTFDWGKTVVHGHTRIPEVHIDERRINIDTGCVYGGKLSAIHMRSMQIYQVPRNAPFEHEFLREPGRSRRRAMRFAGQVEVRMHEPAGLPLFQTLNYNELGVLFVCSHRAAGRLLALYEQVAGTLLPGDDRGDIEFRGVVVRVEETESEIQYAVRFNVPATALR